MGHSPPRRGVINRGNKWQEKNLTNENVDDKKPKNSVMQMNLDEALGTIESQKQELDRVNGLNRDLTAQLEEVNKVLESQEKSKLIGDILPKSQFKVADLAGKSIADLKNIKATLDQAMPPKINSVRYGVHGADMSDREKGLTIGDQSVVTARRRKGAV